MRTDRRTFVAMLGASALPAALHAVPAPAVRPREGAQSLAGRWRFAIDREDAGIGARWFAAPLPERTAIRLPGILQTQGFGDAITAETPFVAALPRDMRWYLLPQYKAYTRPGHVKVPYLSQPVRHYLGVAWYQRDIVVPEGWRGKRVLLTLERTRWRTDVYLGERMMGSNRSLVAPHEVDLGILSPGRHRLSVRIDNRMQDPPYRPDGHGVSDAEGSTWNGIVGRIEVAATSPVWIDDVAVFPDPQARQAELRVAIGNTTGQAGTGRIAAGGVSAPVTWTAAGGRATLVVPMPDARPWSEFDPAIQSLDVALSGGGADDARTVRFGMRSIRTEGDRILLNGEPIDLRMTHDGGGFPLTGYPATDVATWTRIIGICKAWGLNGMRFHSWCPPEAAFEAADTLGFYLQPECGMWNSFDSERRMLAVLDDETARLIRAYGNHPSFVMLGATNEPAGAYHAQLPEWDAKWRKADPRRLYADGIGRFARPPGGAGTRFAADVLVSGSPGRGPRGWFGGDYAEQLKGSTGGVAVPVLGHEIGQYCAYPDFGVIAKFAGQRRYRAFPDGIGSGEAAYMVPGNYEIMRDSAAAHGLLPRNAELAQASGRFQLACYKEEIEANLRTPGYSGFQLLDLHDYLGQGGALIGLLDAFWEEKGYATAPAFRRFAGETVPLVRLKERSFAAGRRLSAEAEIAHFGARPIAGAAPRWRIVDVRGRAVREGALPTRDVPRGRGTRLGTIEADLTGLPAPAAYRLELSLAGEGAGTGVANDWSFWLYPAAAVAPAPAGVVLTASWDEARAVLAKGGRVLFLSGKPATPVPDLALTTTPIFWNRLMNPSRAWMLGLSCDARHPALAGFPTEGHCDWQWTSLLPETTAMNVEALSPALRPVVQPIDDWNRNLRLAMLFEASVGPGRLIASAFDLSEAGAAADPGAAALRRSVLAYLGGRAAPAIRVSAAEADRWAAMRHVAPVVMTAPPATSDVADPGQIRRR